ncbi:flavin-containing monooxygenase FMO GS-OX-like 4 [Andrographis paniculata]|uniref:flavin-containing monooxygenase FMO GS-OX-like 4 n=1 Tax=Andrographis paniculata TaxID=175694 RepID=UPI0021E9097A|nr:flavin-containing monooxygenase FMO GS-OX-like 4 [Andrographis paniculata]
MPTPIQIPVSTMPSPVSRSVAVIGAGAAGLCAALELRKEGHQVVVYEREDQIGGTWVYTPETESDPMSLHPARKLVHTSLYASLRTNLPREVMGFRQYPFMASKKPGRDSRRFPGHEEVLEYLKDFSQVFGLGDLVRFGREVWHVELVEDRKWIVRSRIRDDGGDDDSEVYDAVVICNGHYTEPRVAELPGIDVWPGKQIHSHNYRVPDPFRNQIVVIIGGAASSDDISRDISKVAKEVHISSRSVEIARLGKLSGHDNIWLHSMIKSVHRDGTVAFNDQTEVGADVIIHCIGYKYHFPFLKTDGIVNVEDNRVGPLYKHVFPPTLAPWLSFVGLLWKVVPFPLFEFQCNWIAGILSGRIPLPSTTEMMSDVEALYASMEASGIPKRYTHRLDTEQFEYDDWLGAQSGLPPVEEWRKKMYWATSRRKRKVPEAYRDEFGEDRDLMAEAHEDFKQYYIGMAPALL